MERAQKIPCVIESGALVDIPLPPIYLAEMRSGPMVVVDGHNRLMSFFEFIDGRYQLKGLNLMSHLNGDTIHSMSSSMRRKIEDYYLQVHVIRKETHPELRFEIARRVHEGAAKLKKHEIRMLFVEESVQQFLKELGWNHDFRRVIVGKIPERLVRDPLTFLSFL